MPAENLSKPQRKQCLQLCWWSWHRCRRIPNSGPPFEIHLRSIEDLTPFGTSRSSQHDSTFFQVRQWFSWNQIKTIFQDFPKRSICCHNNCRIFMDFRHFHHIFGGFPTSSYLCRNQPAPQGAPGVRSSGWTRQRAQSARGWNRWPQGSAWGHGYNGEQCHFEWWIYGESMVDLWLIRVHNA